VHSLRTFEDATGGMWRVSEHESDDGDWSLVFMSPSAMRRVRRYPHDWCVLSPDELEALSWER
jgi:hypothetical protein